MLVFFKNSIEHFVHFCREGRIPHQMTISDIDKYKEGVSIEGFICEAKADSLLSYAKTVLSYPENS